MPELSSGHIGAWCKHAVARAVVCRAIKIAIIVGTVLAVINYGDKLWNGVLTDRDLLKILATYVVPYCVATYSAACALAARE